MTDSEFVFYNLSNCLKLKTVVQFVWKIYFLKIFFGAFVPLFSDRVAEAWTGDRGERGNGTQQGATRWNRTCGR